QTRRARPAGAVHLRPVALDLLRRQYLVHRPVYGIRDWFRTDHLQGSAHVPDAVGNGYGKAPFRGSRAGVASVPWSINTRSRRLRQFTSAVYRLPIPIGTYFFFSFFSIWNSRINAR